MASHVTAVTLFGGPCDGEVIQAIPIGCPWIRMPRPTLRSTAGLVLSETYEHYYLTPEGRYEWQKPLKQES